MCLLAQFTFAQSDAGAGALRGEISTADGKAAVDAAVTVRNAETGYLRELHSDGRGQFDAQALPVGRYFVQAAQGDSKSDEVEAIVTVGRTHTMALALKSVSADTGGKETTVQTQTMVMNTD
ncbi:MAG TPA: carboxypeptidase-like regulatory domain-containing protein, partial [Verrucomicrobiae bacterium]|nr:carboxypeptidase-like regulatory domain-containing protein [Verrucomicrobiae bacterium]